MKTLTLAILLGSFVYCKGQTQVICPGQPVPSGWIQISTQAVAGGCGNAGHSTQMLVIKRIDNLPSGAKVTACPGQPIPAGWVRIGVQDCAGCCGNAGHLTKMEVLKKL